MYKRQLPTLVFYKRDSCAWSKKGEISLLERLGCCLAAGTKREISCSGESSPFVFKHLIFFLIKKEEAVGDFEVIQK